MDRAHRWRLASVITALIGLLATAVVFRGGSAGYVTVFDHGLHAPLGPQLSFQLSVTAPEPGSMLPGAEIISHLEGGRGEKPLRGARGGRMIYTGTTAGEPTMGIDKKGNIFFQGNGPNVVVSRDGGKSWENVTPATHRVSLDPMLHVDTRTGRAFTADLTELACTTVSHTDDVGESWTTSKACGLTDHQNVFTGPPVSSSTVGYPNVLYMCAIDGGASADASTATSCLKSLDGGVAWVRTGAPAYTSDLRQEEGNSGIPGFCDGGTGHGFVDSEGTVYLPRGWCGQPFLAISTDEGATWDRIQVAENGMPRATSGVFEHEAAVAVDDKGNIYYFWTARNRLPYLAVSTNKGKSFSRPLMVGPPGLKEAWGPTIAVGGRGKIALAYVGSTNAPGGKSPVGEGGEYTNRVTWNGYITTSVDALAKRPRLLTTSINRRSDPIMRGECGVIRCGVQWDFIDVVIGPDGRPWTSMVDGCLPPGDRCDASPGLGFVGTVVGGPKLR